MCAGQHPRNHPRLPSHPLTLVRFFLAVALGDGALGLIILLPHVCLFPIDRDLDRASCVLSAIFSTLRQNILEDRILDTSHKATRVARFLFCRLRVRRFLRCHLRNTLTVSPPKHTMGEGYAHRFDRR